MKFISKLIVSWLQSNFTRLEQNLINRRKCDVYKSQVMDPKLNAVDRIFAVEDNRKRAEIQLSRDRFDAMGMFLNFLIKANAKLRFNSIRLVLEFSGIYLETLRIMIIGKKDFLSSGSMSELGILSGGICLIFAPSAKKSFFLISSRHKKIINIHRVDCVRTERPTMQAGQVSSKPLTKRIMSEGLSMRAFLILPIVYSIESLIELYRTNTEGGAAKLYCLGTMNLFNRILAMAFLANGGEVILKNHGVVRDCVAEFAVCSQALPYENGKPPISEPFFLG